MAKATFTVGVFGLACWNDNGTLRIKVNVRTDQEVQRQRAGVLPDSEVKIIDMPGGGVQLEDFPDPKKTSLLDVLRREVAEETNGCTIEPLGDFNGPVVLVVNTDDPKAPAGDLAFWMPIILRGKPCPSEEALDHPWISLEELEAGTAYRAIEGLGKAGRTGAILRSAFEFFEARKSDSRYFSTPS